MKIYWGTRAVAQVVIECLASMMKFWSSSQHSTKWAWGPAALEVQHGHLARVWPSWPWMLSCYATFLLPCLGQEKNRTEQMTLSTLCFCMSCSYEECWACSSTEGLSDGEKKGLPQNVPSVTKASVNLLSMPITIMSWAVTPKFTCASPSPQNLRMWPYLEIRLL